MVNEVAPTLLSVFGWKVALLYLGWADGGDRGGLGHRSAQVEGIWKTGCARCRRPPPWWARPRLPWRARRAGIRLGVSEIVGKVWPYILGHAIGAGIHGYVPGDFMASFMGGEAWWRAARRRDRVPMVHNAAGRNPRRQALLAKGAALGTVLAFMMSVIALSLPER